MTDNPKPKSGSLFRWSYLIPGLAVVALLVLFNVLFLDALLKGALIGLGQFMFGAKVEIASLDFRFRDLSLALTEVRVADRAEPMRNLFTFEQAALALEPLPLLSNKFIIPELRLDGVRWGTAREHSGALPPSQQKRRAARLAPADSSLGKMLARLETKAQAEWEALPAWESIQEAKRRLDTASLEAVVKPEELQTVRQSRERIQSLRRQSDQLKVQLDSLDIQGKLQSVQPALEELRGLQVNTPQEAAAAAAKIENARNRLAELQALQDRLQALRRQAESEFGRLGDLSSQIASWQEQDLQALAAQFRLPALSFGNLAQALVGPAWLARVGRFVELVNLARRYMPPRGERETKTVRPRLHGVDVSFPVRNTLPGFLVRTALLSGSTGGPGKTGEAFDFSGRVSDLTSDPRLLGRPCLAEILGSQGDRSYAVTALLDHTREVPKDSISLSARGLAAAGLRLPRSDYLPDFNQGRLNLTGIFSLEGDDLTASLQLDLNGLDMQGPGASGDEVERLAHELWRGVEAVSVQARLTGSPEDVRLDLSSDLDRILGGRLQALAGEKLAGLRAKLAAEIDRAAAEQIQALRNQFDQSASGVLGPITDQQSSVQQKIDAVRDLIQEKQNLAQQAVDNEKRQAEEQLKQGAQDQLKNLFGK